MDAINRAGYSLVLLTDPLIDCTFRMEADRLCILTTTQEQRVGHDLDRKCRRILLL